ncbi:hypothetical protein CBM2586_B90377 [Cupriavidus phytorum]|uniref:Uncharacterized protein n=1 Tax=Cupriavidus taiwanensis TaxID=164546 RepID=A0A976FSC8_9BURK|nr:hypothetical protein CBM2586_B90377 [Cupriavidus taiwanensis]
MLRAQRFGLLLPCGRSGFPTRGALGRLVACPRQFRHGSLRAFQPRLHDLAFLRQRFALLLQRGARLRQCGFPLRQRGLGRGSGALQRRLPQVSRGFRDGLGTAWRRRETLWILDPPAQRSKPRIQVRAYRVRRPSPQMQADAFDGRPLAGLEQAVGGLPDVVAGDASAAERFHGQDSTDYSKVTNKVR